MTQDEQQLKLLSVFHYVVGGIMALFSSHPPIEDRIAALQNKVQ